MSNILIANDHAILRRGLKQILQQALPDVICGEAQDAAEVMDQVRAGSWDLLIVDITMPGRSGLDALRDVKNLRPNPAGADIEHARRRSVREPRAEGWRVGMHEEGERAGGIAQGGCPAARRRQLCESPPRGIAGAGLDALHPSVAARDPVGPGNLRSFASSGREERSRRSLTT